MTAATENLSETAKRLIRIEEVLLYQTKQGDALKRRVMALEQRCAHLENTTSYLYAMIEAARKETANG